MGKFHRHQLDGNIFLMTHREKRKDSKWFSLRSREFGDWAERGNPGS